jgi:hypothetical protein
MIFMIGLAREAFEIEQEADQASLELAVSDSLRKLLILGETCFLPWRKRYHR